MASPTPSSPGGLDLKEYATLELTPKSKVRALLNSFDDSPSPSSLDSDEGSDSELHIKNEREIPRPRRGLAATLKKRTEAEPHQQTNFAAEITLEESYEQIRKRLLAKFSTSHLQRDDSSTIDGQQAIRKPAVFTKKVKNNNILPATWLGQRLDNSASSRSRRAVTPDDDEHGQHDEYEAHALEDINGFAPFQLEDHVPSDAESAADIVGESLPDLNTFEALVNNQQFKDDVQQKRVEQRIRKKEEEKSRKLLQQVREEVTREHDDIDADEEICATFRFQRKVCK